MREAECTLVCLPSQFPPRTQTVKYWALDRLGHPKRRDSDTSYSVSQAWSPYLRNGFHTLRCDEVGEVQGCLQVKNSTELTLSYYVLFHLGEKRHATNSMVFLTDLRAPAHPVQKWPNISPTTAGINKPSWIPRISVVIHFQSLGVTCVWSDMRACPSISQVRKHSKRLFPEVMVESYVWGLGVSSTKTAAPLLTFQPEGGQEALGVWAPGTLQSTQIHSPKNTVKVCPAHQHTVVKPFSLLIRCRTLST